MAMAAMGFLASGWTQLTDHGKIYLSKKVPGVEPASSKLGLFDVVWENSRSLKLGPRMGVVCFLFD